MIDPKAYLANLQAEQLGVVLTDWRNIGAQAVSKGRVTGAPGGKSGEVSLEFKLYEIGRGDQPVLEKKYTGPASKARWLAHQWSTEVVRFFSPNESTFFDTQIAFAASGSSAA